ncbi:hypothetical protein HanXRQr2_Chr16g0756141 [Helianthus annuus]|nr:hypothetical protein HanXRQr2_Chr16g0756141 [Helianthus annuus]
MLLQISETSPEKLFSSWLKFCWFRILCRLFLGVVFLGSSWILLKWLGLGVSESTSFTVSSSTGGGALLDLDECRWKSGDPCGLWVLAQQPICWILKKIGTW